MGRSYALAVSLLAVLGTMTLPAPAAAGITDHLLEGLGEFELSNGEKRVIAHHKTDKVYRVCVARARNSVPVQVTFDDKSETIAPGNCADVEGKRISVTPAAKMDVSQIVAGRFHLVASP